MGKTKPYIESLVQRLRNKGAGGIPSRPCIYIYIYIYHMPHSCNEGVWDRLHAERRDLYLMQRLLAVRGLGGLGCRIQG